MSACIYTELTQLTKYRFFVSRTILVTIVSWYLRLHSSMHVMTPQEKKRENWFKDLINMCEEDCTSKEYETDTIEKILETSRACANIVSMEMRKMVNKIEIGILEKERVCEYCGKPLREVK